jgi:hypothetical protein
MKRAVAITILLIVAATAAADTIPLAAYVAGLEEIQALLVSKQIALAQEKARALAAHDVTSPSGKFHADTALLESIATTQRADLRLQARLHVAIDELRRTSPNDPASADRKLLRRVADEQKVPDLVPGGDVPVDADVPPLIARVFESIGDVFAWIGEKLERILEWLFDLVPHSSSAEPEATGGMRWIVTALVTVIVLLIALLAIEVTRRSRRAAAKTIATSLPIGSKRDEDPLSRGANEWERYAAQLADAGRFREAIRAWYHAVLVTCYSAGLLHYRKGRTNWEYVAALAPSTPWRADFIALTRRFEREWYGSDQSSDESLDDCTRVARSIMDTIHVTARGAA